MLTDFFDSTNDRIHEIEIIFRIEYQPALREITLIFGDRNIFQQFLTVVEFSPLIKLLKIPQFFLEFLSAHF